MIHEMKQKIKAREADIFLFSVCVLLTVSIAGGLRLWSHGKGKAPLAISQEAFTLPLAAVVGGHASSSVEAVFVASKNGTKYYPAACASARRIKDENKIFFVSEKEAQNAGYERTAQCK